MGSNEPEKERIQNAGGSVMIQRVNGSLAVSRALGDFEYKNVDGKGPTEQLVSPEPEFYIKERDESRDEFLVLACDGVWDVMSNEEICSFIGHRMRVHDNLETICNEVIDTCLYKGSRDNMSIIIIAFPSAPKVDPAAQKVDEELVGLPPGGGLASKKVFIEDIYKRLLPERYETSQDESPNPLASLLFTNAKKEA